MDLFENTTAQLFASNKKEFNETNGARVPLGKIGNENLSKTAKMPLKAAEKPKAVIHQLGINQPPPLDGSLSRSKQLALWKETKKGLGKAPDVQKKIKHNFNVFPSPSQLQRRGTFSRESTPKYQKTISVHNTKTQQTESLTPQLVPEPKLTPAPQLIPVSDLEKESLTDENKRLSRNLDLAETEILNLKTEIENLKATTISKQRFEEIRVALKETIDLSEDLYNDRKEQDELIAYYQMICEGIRLAEDKSEQNLKRKRTEDEPPKRLILPFPKSLPKPPPTWSNFISSKKIKMQDNSCQTDKGYHQLLTKNIHEREKYAFSNELMHQQMKENLEKYEQNLVAEKAKWKEMVDQTVSTQKTMVSALQLSATRIQSLEAALALSQKSQNN